MEWLERGYIDAGGICSNDASRLKTKDIRIMADAESLFVKIGTISRNSMLGQ